MMASSQHNEIIRKRQLSFAETIEEEGITIRTKEIEMIKKSLEKKRKTKQQPMN
jgi:hypothetical protein